MPHMVYVGKAKAAVVKNWWWEGNKDDFPGLDVYEIPGDHMGGTGTQGRGAGRDPQRGSGGGEGHGAQESAAALHGYGLLR